MKLRTKILIGAAIVIGGFFALQFPYDKLIGDRQDISEAVTRLTEPVRDDGSIDYLAALNEFISEGVTPDNNALIPLASAIRIEGYSPGEVFISEYYQKTFFELLGVEGFGEGQYLREPALYLQEEHPTDDEAVQSRRDEQHSQLVKTPWRAETYPLWHEWLVNNNRPLDAIVAATSRERYFQPLVCAEPYPNGNMVGVMLPESQSLRYAARGLCFRAMFRLGNDDIGTAIADLKATRKLGQYATQSVTLVEQLIGCAIYRMASDCERQLLANPNVTREQLLDYGRFLAELKPYVSTAKRIDLGERFMMLDLLQLANIHGLSPTHAMWPREDRVFIPMLTFFVDWNESMRFANEAYDRLVAIAEEESHSKRMEKFRDFEREIYRWEEEISDVRSSALSMISGPRSRGRWMGKLMSAMLMPAISSVCDAETDSYVGNDLIRVGIALELYRRDLSEFPSALDQLTPEYMDEIPADRFNELPLKYKKSDAGYLLYSVGRDLSDDGGINYDESREQNANRPRSEHVGYDVRIRIGGK